MNIMNGGGSMWKCPECHVVIENRFDDCLCGYRRSPLCIVPCPHCAGEASVHRTGIFTPGTKKGFAVVCNDCGSIGSWQEEKNDAIAAWNLRTQQKAEKEGK